MRRLIPWLRARRAGWSAESDRAFHDAIFAAHDHDAFSPAYTGNITVRRFADLAAAWLDGCSDVLDVGCGLGEITCELARRHPAVRFHGVDHSAAGIEGAQRNAARLGLGNVTFEAHDMERYTPRGNVDLVMMFDAFHHLLDAAAFIRRMGGHTDRFLLIEPQGDWKGSWARGLDFDWLAADLEKVRAHLAVAVGEPAASDPAARSGPERPEVPGADTEQARRISGHVAAESPAAVETATSTDSAEPVENRYSIETFEKLFAGYGLHIRGTVSGLDEYPPDPTLDTPSRRRFGELGYQLYRDVDDWLRERGLDLHAKHLVIHARAGAAGEERRRPAELPDTAGGSDLRGAHDVEYRGYSGPERGAPSEAFHVTVTVRNRGFRVLSSNRPEHPEMLSYHWLDERGQTIHEDGVRTPLPRDLAPDEEAAVALRVESPPRAGTYVLAIDLVQEGKTWFRDAGCPTLDVRFRVDD